MSYKFKLFSQLSRQHDNNCCSDPTLVFSIGAARNNEENRLHTNNMPFSFFSYLIMGAKSSKDVGWYEFQFLNYKYNRFIRNAADANPTSAFSIGASRNNEENRLLTNNTRSPFFSCLIIEAASSKDNGGYKFVLSNDKCI